VSAFPKFQINLDYDAGMFTIRAETFEEFVEALTKAGDQDIAEALLNKIRTGLENLIDTPPRGRQSTAQDALEKGGIQTTRLEYKLCPGHNEPMALREAKTGARKGNKFWSCTAKIKGGPNNGDFAFKHGEGCKPEDFADGDEKYVPQNA